MESWNNTEIEKEFFVTKLSKDVYCKCNAKEERKETKTYLFKYHFVTNDQKMHISSAFYLLVLPEYHILYS